MHIARIQITGIPFKFNLAIFFAVLPFSNTVLYIICAGVGAVLILLLILVLALCIICCCCRKKNRYNKYTKDHLRSAGNIELGNYKRTNPISGSKR